MSRTIFKVLPRNFKFVLRLAVWWWIQSNCFSKEPVVTRNLSPPRNFAPWKFPRKFGPPFRKFGPPYNCFEASSVSFEFFLEKSNTFPISLFKWTCWIRRLIWCLFLASLLCFLCWSMIALYTITTCILMHLINNSTVHKLFKIDVWGGGFSKGGFRLWFYVYTFTIGLESTDGRVDKEIMGKISKKICGVII